MTTGQLIPPIPETSPEAEVLVEHDGTRMVYYHGEPICELGRKKSLPDYWCRPEPGYRVGRCKMIMRMGQRCRNPVRRNWTVCHKHGAGRPSRPGGITNKAISGGNFARHSKYLPTGLLEKYEDYLLDPDTLNMSQEMALLDTRTAELLDTLGKMDIKQSWVWVGRAYSIFNRQSVSEDDWERGLELLNNAISSHEGDVNTWDEIKDIIERRRKLAETERRRIVKAQQMMTYQEANQFIAFLMSSVMEHVKDPVAKRAITEDLKRVTM